MSTSAPIPRGSAVPAGPPPPTTRPEPTPRAILRTVLIVLCVVFALFLIYELRKPISWLVIATFLAIALSGPVNLLSRRMPRGFAILIAYLTLILVPIGIAALIIPPLVNELTDLAKNVPKYVQDAQDWLTTNPTLKRLDDQYDIGARLQQKAEELPTHLDDAASTLSSVGSTVVGSLFEAFNIFVLSIFMVAGGRRWIDRGITLARPEHAPRIRRAVDRIAIAVGNYVGGALFQATIAGITTFIVLTILGVPFAAPLSAIVFIFDLIPLVGATLAAIVVGLVTVFNDFPLDTIIWVIWAIVYQQIENNVIQPQIQKRAVEIHPFMVLVSVLFGATLFGIVGALLAIPFAASLQIAAREWWDYRNASQVEMPPGVDLPEPPPLPPDEPLARLDLPPGVDPERA
ncbi:MAG TPA: AI-2E family transporter [Conexibacter sp.]|nr:AI-2E family transporter [Conexibacter sp.]